MDRGLKVKFDRVSRLYWWVPPVAVIVVTIIDDLIAEGGAREFTGFLAWAASVFSILYYHSGLVFDNWRNFDDQQLERRVKAFREMLHPGVWLIFVGAHVVAIVIGVLAWRWVRAALS